MIIKIYFMNQAKNIPRTLYKSNYAKLFKFYFIPVCF
jgi:hypothetical protein